MKQSNAYLIIIVTIIFVGITSIVSLYKDSENRRVEGERFLFPELSVSTDVNSLKSLNEIAEINIATFNENFSIIRNKDNWYLGAMTDWTPRNFKIDLETFLPSTTDSELIQQACNFL